MRGTESCDNAMNITPVNKQYMTVHQALERLLDRSSTDAFTVFESKATKQFVQFAVSLDDFTGFWMLNYDILPEETLLVQEDS